MKLAAKGDGCKHLRCFDLESFLRCQEKTPYWTCPVCGGPAKLDELRICEFVFYLKFLTSFVTVLLPVFSYFNEVLANTAGDVRHVEVTSDGSYRPAADEEFSDIEIIDDEAPYQAPEVDVKPEVLDMVRFVPLFVRLDCSIADAGLDC